MILRVKIIWRNQYLPIPCLDIIKYRTLNTSDFPINSTFLNSVLAEWVQGANPHVKHNELSNAKASFQPSF